MHRGAWLAVAAVNSLIGVLGEILGGVVLPGIGATEAAQLVGTGARFQIVHALATIGLCALGWPRDSVAWLFLYGTLLFSGGLYLRAFGMPYVVIGCAALGALLAALGWLILTWSALLHRRG